MRKGIFFTITAVLLLLALATVIAFQAKYKPTDRTVLESRTSSMNDFVRTVKSDLQRGLYISSFRAVLSMQEYVTGNGVYISDVQPEFRKAMTTGMIGNQSMNLMDDSTFTDWTSRIKSAAKEANILANISIDGLGIRHIDSWTLLVESNISINITDDLNTASWRFNQSVSSQIPVSGLEDPFFTIMSNGKITRQVNITPYEGNYAPSGNTANLKKHIDGFYYSNSTGPSYLMRLEGNFSNSSFGMESFVNVPELQANSISQYKNTMVDYVYIGNLTSQQLYKVNGTYENWLIIGSESRQKYQVTGLTTPLS